MEELIAQIGNFTPIQLGAWLVAIVAVGFFVWLFISSITKNKENKLRRLAEAQVMRDAELARIVEHSALTFGGGFCAIMVVVFNLTALFAYYSSTTILQQTVAVLSAISASAFWGVFVALGIKRTYTVYRVLPPPQLVEPRTE